MKKLSHIVAFLFCLVAFSKKGTAQFYFLNDNYYYTPVTFEFGASVGAMNCLTDLGGKEGIGKQFLKDLNYGNTNVTVGGYFTTMYKAAVGLRLEANLGKIGRASCRERVS